jgi:hypothetical protein
MEFWWRRCCMLRARSMTVLVRPFEVFFARDSQHAAPSIRGAINAGRFVASTLHQDIELEAQFGIDASGPYALLAQKTYDLNGGARLAVGYDDLEHAATISVEIGPRVKRCIDDGDGLSLGFWVHFDSQGSVEGKGTADRGPTVLSVV